jgi:molybdopterin-guanine dinucleotide biosynthesis protein A
MDCPSADWTGILLAGGQSQRMGQDKRHMSVSCLQNRSLLEHSSLLLSQLCAQRVVLVGAAAEQNLPAGFQPVVDRQPGMGPLPAICDCLQTITTPFALTIPVDMPCLQPQQLRQLMLDFERSEASEGACFTLDGNHRPTFPLLAKQEFATSLAAEIAAGQVRLFQGLRAAGASHVQPQWPQADSCSPNPFVNLNRPTDVDHLESGFQQNRP